MDRVNVEIRVPRKRLTLEQRAARTTKMKIKQLLAKNPLLSSELTPDGSLADWRTTPEREAKRITNIVESWQAAQIHMRDFDEDMSDRALHVRDLVAARVSPAELARLDTQRQCYPASPAYDHSHWYHQLRAVDQPAAAELCENDHTQMVRWHERCPRCWTPLEQPQRPQQMQLGEAA